MTTTATYGRRMRRDRRRHRRLFRMCGAPGCRAFALWRTVRLGGTEGRDGECRYHYAARRTGPASAELAVAGVFERWIRTLAIPAAVETARGFAYRLLEDVAAGGARATPELVERLRSWCAAHVDACLRRRARMVFSVDELDDRRLPGRPRKPRPDPNSLAAIRRRDRAWLALFEGELPRRPTNAARAAADRALLVREIDRLESRVDSLERLVKSLRPGRWGGRKETE